METNDPAVSNYHATRRGSYWTPIFAAAILFLAGVNAYQSSRMETLRRQIAAFEQDNATLRSNLSSSDEELQKALASLRIELANARQETSSSLAKAQVAVSRHADALVGSLEKKRQEHEEHVNAELSKVKASTEEASVRLNGISTDVGAVKTDVDAVRSENQKTTTDLQRVRGDLGLMSGLLATNSKEIQTLRELGDRNVYEFKLTKSGGMQRVGDIQVMLTKADPKRNRFTVEVLADDKRVEKRDRTINEPVQFYVASKSRQPYEFVVNEVGKNTVSGYLATPKTPVNPLRAELTAK
jgi:hypothetical protein